MTTRWAGILGLLCLAMAWVLPSVSALADTAQPRWIYAGAIIEGVEGGLLYEFVDVANVRRLNGKVTYWQRGYSGDQLDPIADADPREQARTARLRAAINAGHPPPRIDVGLTAHILEDALDEAGLPETETYGLMDCSADRSRILEKITYLYGERREVHYSEAQQPWAGVPPASTLAAIEHLVCRPGVAR